MNQASQTLAQLKKASKLVRLAFHKNGPKSYKRGQGALLNALVDNDGTTQRELVKILGLNRSELKDIVKKAERNGYVTIEDAEGERTYAVKLTDEGREVAQKRVAANDKTADDIIGCLSEEEIAQLNAITEKLILSMKDKGINGKKKGRKAHECCCRARPEGPQGPGGLLPLNIADGFNRRAYAPSSEPPASPEAGGSSMQAAPACEVHAFRSARAVLTVGSRRADIGAAQLRARRGAVVSVAVQRRIPSPCVPFCPMFHVKHLCWRAERYGREGLARVAAIESRVSSK